MRVISPSASTVSSSNNGRGDAGSSAGTDFSYFPRTFKIDIEYGGNVRTKVEDNLLMLSVTGTTLFGSSIELLSSGRGDFSTTDSCHSPPMPFYANQINF